MTSSSRGGSYTGKKLERTATFNGILTRNGNALVSTGHFLLAERPRDATTSTQFSEHVLMQKVQQALKGRKQSLLGSITPSL